MQKDYGKKRILRYRWAVFGILAVAYFFVYFHRVSTAVVSADLERSFYVSAASIALLSSTYFYAYAIMQLPSGLLTDSLGPRKTVSIFTILAAAGAVLTGIATTFDQVIAGRLLIGIGVAMVYIPTMKIIASWYRKNEFASLSGILLAVGNLGALCAAGPLAFLSQALGWQKVFIILGMVSLFLALAAWQIIRDHPQDMGLPSIQEIEAGDKARSVNNRSVNKIQENGSGKRIPMIEALKITFGSGMKFWPLAVWFFFLYGTVMVYQGLWAGAFYHDILGWNTVTSGLVLTFIGIGMIFGCPTAGYISDKILRSRRKVLIIGTVIYTLIWAAIWLTAGQTNSLEAYIAINFLFGFFGGFFVVGFAQIKELFPAGIVGTSTAALNIFPFAGGAVLQQASGTVLTTRSLESYQNLWMLMFVCMGIATLAAFLSQEKGQETIQ